MIVAAGDASCSLHITHRHRGFTYPVRGGTPTVTAFHAIGTTANIQRPYEHNIDQTVLLRSTSNGHLRMFSGLTVLVRAWPNSGGVSIRHPFLVT